LKTGETAICWTTGTFERGFFLFDEKAAIYHGCCLQGDRMRCEKIAQSVAQPSLAKLMHNFNREKSCPNVWTTKK
jgi:hypothetical protein